VVSDARRSRDLPELATDRIIVVGRTVLTAEHEIVILVQLAHAEPLGGLSLAAAPVAELDERATRAAAARETVRESPHVDHLRPLASAVISTGFASWSWLLLRT
jgi:hypothetical protein